MTNPIRLTSAYLGLPRNVRGRVRNYFFKRLTGQSGTTHETIWTSFLYFAASHKLRISETGINQFEVVWLEGTRQRKALIRDSPSSDVFVFFQVFIARGYEPLFDFLKKNNVEVSSIVDAGVNVGYFSQCAIDNFFPKILIGLEPEKNNFLQASKNVLPQSACVTLLNAALWTHNTTVSLRVDAGNDWGVRISEAENANEVSEAISVSELFKRMKVETIDLFKMDIEGAEFELFRSEQFLQDLKRVKCLAIEIHDSVGDRRLVIESLQKLHFNFFEVGELTVAWNTNFVHV
jgi:FkbM family methyltransferase